MEQITEIGADNQLLHEGDRVYTYDIAKDGKPTRYYGTLYLNVDYPTVSTWYVEYDDGEECAVLDIQQIYKA